MKLKNLINSKTGKPVEIDHESLVKRFGKEAVAEFERKARESGARFKAALSSIIEESS